MKRRFHERYTILITRTGQEPRVLSIRPRAVFLLLFLAAALLISWTAASGYAYYKARALRDTEQRLQLLSEQARQLSLELATERNRNEHLAEQAAQMLQDLDSLEAEINRLRKRAGLPKIELTPASDRSPASDGKGGGQPLSTEDLYNLTAERLKALTADLNVKVEPALQETLAKEEARPVGYPLKVKTYIASGFGTRRNPFGRGYEFHNGIDLPAWYGTPIYATAPGKVIEAGWSNIFGRYVKIDHGYGYQTLYGHMSKILVKRGETVQRGQQIGKVGSTGRSSGPHVHYSVFIWGKAVNPAPYLKAPTYANR